MTTQKGVKTNNILDTSAARAKAMEVRQREPNWVERMIIACALSNPSMKKLADEYGVSRNTIKRWKRMPKIEKRIQAYKENSIEKARDTLFSVTGFAAGVIKDVIIKYRTTGIEDLGKDEIKFCIDVLKGTGVWNDKQKIDHSGDIRITLVPELNPDYGRKEEPRKVNEINDE